MVFNYLKTRLETDKRKLSHWLVPPMGEAELSEAVVPPQHWPHSLPFHVDGTVWWKPPCARGLCTEYQPLLQFQTQGLGWCVQGKWPQRQGPASNESTVSVSKSPSKYRFIGLLIKITDSLSDGCPETQGDEKAVGIQSYNPKLMSPYHQPPPIKNGRGKCQRGKKMSYLYAVPLKL